jgi:hypothetical protein
MRASRLSQKEASSMHQQIRVTLTTPSSVVDGTGAMAAVKVAVEPREIAPGALIGLLKLLDHNGYNLRLAGGKGIETGGEFVFAIDDEHDKMAAAKCVRFLHANHYPDARVVEPLMCEVEDKKGTLHECLEKQMLDGALIDEVFVGTPGEDGLIPIHVTTIQPVAQQERQPATRR